MVARTVPSTQRMMDMYSGLLKVKLEPLSYRVLQLHKEADIMVVRYVA